MKLILGVWDIPYSGKGVTTGVVANWLEKGTKTKDGRQKMGPYHIMQTYINKNTDFVKKEIAEELTDILIRKRKVSSAVQMDAIASGIREAISLQAFNGTQGNKIPTQAALLGKTSRFKKGKKKGPRPSFIDTGLYQKSIRVVLKP
jgi:hypothetical protein